MKGLKIIPIFLILMGSTYLGMLFVEANRNQIVITLGQYSSPPAATGFVVLTSILVGMILCGFFCSIELLALYMQNRRLKRRLDLLPKKASVEPQSNLSNADVIDPRASNRFT